MPPVTLPGKTVPQLTAATSLDVTDAGLFIFRPEATGVLSKLPASAMPAAAGGPGDVRRYGAKFDGTLHPLSEFFPTVNAARAKLGSFVNALTESIDRCATQAAVNAVTFMDANAKGCFPVVLPYGVGIWDYPVNLGSHPVQVVGAGPLQTVLKQTAINCPFFTSFPDAIPLPSLVTGAPGSQKGIKFNGLETDGFVNCSDTGATEFTTETWTMEGFVRFDSWPGSDFSLRTIFGCGGSLDGSLGQWDESLQLTIYRDTGATKLRVFTRKDGAQDFADFTLPGPPTLGQWYHLAVTRSGGVLKPWFAGTQLGTFTQSFISNQVRRPWETVWLGIEPLNWPATANTAQAAFDGAVAGYRLSNSLRYTSNFTPPSAAFTNDANTLCILDLDTVDGLFIRAVNGVQGISEGLVLWHQGNYSGDIQGAGISDVGFYQGSYGVYVFGMHNAKFEYLTSQFTTYPLCLAGHSFQNDIQSINFSGCKVGVSLLDVSFASVHDFQISGATAFAIATVESTLHASDGFTFALGAGSILAKKSQLLVNNLFQTDEAISTAVTFGIYCSACPTVEIRNSLLLTSLTSPAATIPVKLVGCLAATIQDTAFYVADSYTECVSIVDGGPNQLQALFKFDVSSCPVLKSTDGTLSAVPLTTTPARIKVNDERIPTSVNDNATLATNILTHAAKSGLVLAVDATTPRDALYRLTGTTLTLVSGDAVFSTVQGTGSKINVYNSGGKITMENKTGGPLLLAAHEK